MLSSSSGQAVPGESLPGRLALSKVSEGDCAQLLKTLQRDYDLRTKEKERLGRSQGSRRAVQKHQPSVSTRLAEKTSNRAGATEVHTDRVSKTLFNNNDSRNDFPASNLASNHTIPSHSQANGSSRNLSDVRSSHSKTSLSITSQSGRSGFNESFCLRCLTHFTPLVSKRIICYVCKQNFCKNCCPRPNRNAGSGQGKRTSEVKVCLTCLNQIASGLPSDLTRSPTSSSSWNSQSAATIPSLSRSPPCSICLTSSRQLQRSEPCPHKNGALPYRSTPTRHYRGIPATENNRNTLFNGDNSTSSSQVLLQPPYGPFHQNPHNLSPSEVRGVDARNGTERLPRFGEVSNRPGYASSTEQSGRSPSLQELQARSSGIMNGKTYGKTAPVEKTAALLAGGSSGAVYPASLLSHQNAAMEEGFPNRNGTELNVGRVTGDSYVTTSVVNKFNNSEYSRSGTRSDATLSSQLMLSTFPDVSPFEHSGGSHFDGSLDSSSPASSLELSPHSWLEMRMASAGVGDRERRCLESDQSLLPRGRPDSDHMGRALKKNGLAASMPLLPQSDKDSLFDPIESLERSLLHGTSPSSAACLSHPAVPLSHHSLSPSSAAITPQSPFLSSAAPTPFTPLSKDEDFRISLPSLSAGDERPSRDTANSRHSKRGADVLNPDDFFRHGTSADTMEDDRISLLDEFLTNMGTSRSSAKVSEEAQLSFDELKERDVKTFMEEINEMISNMEEDIATEIMYSKKEKADESLLELYKKTAHTLVSTLEHALHIAVDDQTLSDESTFTQHSDVAQIIHDTVLLHLGVEAADGTDETAQSVDSQSLGDAIVEKILSDIHDSSHTSQFSEQFETDQVDSSESVGSSDRYGAFPRQFGRGISTIPEEEEEEDGIVLDESTLTGGHNSENMMSAHDILPAKRKLSVRGPPMSLKKFETAHQRATAVVGKLPSFLTSSGGELDPDLLSLGGDSTANDDNEEQMEDYTRQQESQNSVSNWFMRNGGLLSPYENVGGKRLRTSSEDSAVMFVPQTSPTVKLGERNVEEFSDDLSDHTVTSGGAGNLEDDHDLDYGVTTNQKEGITKEKSEKWDDGGHTSGYGSSPHQSPSSTSTRDVDRPQSPLGGTPSFSEVDMSSHGSDSDKVRFVSPPHTVRVIEGETAEWTCQIKCDTTYDVFWYREVNGQTVSLDDESKYETSEIGSSHSLSLSFASPTDSGRYTCIAVAGKESSYWSFGLQVEAVKERGTQPVFLKKLDDIEVQEGSTAKFKVKVGGIPPPRVTWYKDGKRVKAGERLTIEKIGNRDYVLKIKGASAQDDAEYSVSAQNVAGVERSSGQLLVELADSDEDSTSKQDTNATVSATAGFKTKDTESPGKENVAAVDSLLVKSDLNVPVRMGAKDREAKFSVMGAKPLDETGVHVRNNTSRLTGSGFNNHSTSDSRDMTNSDIGGSRGPVKSLRDAWKGTSSGTGESQDSDYEPFTAIDISQLTTTSPRQSKPDIFDNELSATKSAALSSQERAISRTIVCETNQPTFKNSDIHWSVNEAASVAEMTKDADHNPHVGTLIRQNNKTFESIGHGRDLTNVSTNLSGLPEHQIAVSANLTAPSAPNQKTVSIISPALPRTVSDDSHTHAQITETTKSLKKKRAPPVPTSTGFSTQSVTPTQTYGVALPRGVPTVNNPAEASPVAANPGSTSSLYSSTPSQLHPEHTSLPVDTAVDVVNRQKMGAPQAEEFGLHHDNKLDGNTVGAGMSSATGQGSPSSSVSSEHLEHYSVSPYLPVVESPLQVPSLVNDYLPSSISVFPKYAAVSCDSHASCDYTVPLSPTEQGGQHNESEFYVGFTQNAVTIERECRPTGVHTHPCAENIAPQAVLPRNCPTDFRKRELDLLQDVKKHEKEAAVTDKEGVFMQDVAAGPSNKSLTNQSTTPALLGSATLALKRLPKRAFPVSPNLFPGLKHHNKSNNPEADYSVFHALPPIPEKKETQAVSLVDPSCVTRLKRVIREGSCVNGNSSGSMSLTEGADNSPRELDIPPVFKKRPTAHGVDHHRWDYHDDNDDASEDITDDDNASAYAGERKEYSQNHNTNPSEGPARSHFVRSASLKGDIDRETLGSSLPKVNRNITNPRLPESQSQPLHKDVRLKRSLSSADLHHGSQYSEPFTPQQWTSSKYGGRELGGPHHKLFDTPILGNMGTRTASLCRLDVPEDEVPRFSNDFRRRAFEQPKNQYMAVLGNTTERVDQRMTTLNRRLDNTLHYDTRSAGLVSDVPRCNKGARRLSSEIEQSRPRSESGRKSPGRTSTYYLADQSWPRVSERHRDTNNKHSRVGLTRKSDSFLGFHSQNEGRTEPKSLNRNISGHSGFGQEPSERYSNVGSLPHNPSVSNSRCWVPDSGNQVSSINQPEDSQEDYRSSPSLSLNRHRVCRSNSEPRRNVVRKVVKTTIIRRSPASNISDQRETVLSPNQRYYGQTPLDHYSNTLPNNRYGGHREPIGNKGTSNNNRVVDARYEGPAVSRKSVRSGSVLARAAFWNNMEEGGQGLSLEDPSDYPAIPREAFED